MEPSTPVVVAGRRTPFGTAGHALARHDAAALAAPVLAALAEVLRAAGPARPGAAPAVDEVLLGNCCGPGGDVARVAALAAGLGTDVPGVSVDRQCGSGLEAVRLGASLVASGAAELVLAGGVESASTAPWRLARPGSATELPRPYQRAPFAPPGFPDPEMGAAADTLARAHGVGRERQDAYALRSHRRTLAAAAAGVLAAELVPLGAVTADERPRAGLTQATLARLRPAFAADGTVTAGNSCGISDGAAALAVVPLRWARAAGLPGLAVRASAAVGVDPALPGLGAAAAIREVCARGGVALADVAAVEITEAFAAQLLACTDLLGLDPLGADADRVCPDGGAIAVGHPWGASGAYLVLRLLSAWLRRRDGSAGPGGGGPWYGVAACAIGGGQGVAVLLEGIG